MPLWLTIAIIVFIAARWIIWAIDSNAHVIAEKINAVGRKLEDVEEKLGEIEEKIEEVETGKTNRRYVNPIDL